MAGWGGADFAEADRANEYEEARADRWWAERETAADREIDAAAGAALARNPGAERVQFEVGGERVWAVRTGDGVEVVSDEELGLELSPEREER